MPRIHIVSRNPRHLMEVAAPEFESGYWTLYEAEAEKLIGGSLYLHKKKSEASYFGGTITGYRLSSPSDPNPGGVIFKVRAEQACEGVAWEGDKHPMAWMSGILEG